MKTAFLIFLVVIFITNIFAGGVFSGSKVKAIPGVYRAGSAVSRHRVETTQETIERRQKEIEDAVNKISLPRIFVLHARSTTADFTMLHLDEVEQKIFRDAVARRYELNRDHINKVCMDSVEGYRRVMLVEPAREKMTSRRKRRIVWDKTQLDLLGSLSPTPPSRTVVDDGKGEAAI